MKSWDTALGAFRVGLAAKVPAFNNIRILIGIALILASPPACLGTNLVSNGGFESGDFSNWNISGSYACVGSSVCVGNGFTLDEDPGPATGGFAVYLGGCDETYSGCGGEDDLSQTIATVAGVTYTLDFFLSAPTYNGSSTPNTFTVLWSGAIVSTMSDLAGNSYIEYTYALIGSGSDALEFDSSDVPSAFVLDDVSVVDISLVDAGVADCPELGSVLLLGVGLPTVSFLRRRMGTKLTAP